MDPNASSVHPSPMPLSIKATQVKLVLLGESAVGKSSLVIQFVQQGYVENREPTIGAAFLTKKYQTGEQSIKFEIWDTAGQERFHSLAPMYYRNAQAAIVVYDITKAASLDKAKTWVKELQRQASSDIVIALVGNKLDLVQEDEHERQVLAEDAQAYAEEGNLLFYETSAKTSENVDAVFGAIANQIPAPHVSKALSGGRSLNGPNGSFNLMEAPKDTASGCAC
ncbi:ras family-domain-containing protein [Phycomyces blakesleeanus]|uniref:Uncharacterized protein n=2 Tax=Phycomyces blakesleeanus TaxID=4837 RepID=A0A162X2X2_PHYB8|nr:hypothetical protein PHYBLDRAFT_32959 [Phycomyces blakesleeanus NRRL 1555(-)]OAD72235.1 hypothetical protein PHYBLDRAFT_32959 [Phycomyces blakesleeanus NRRL 1555(-)]|eukprot:XP_018290275.1 hypothetical protein PHYBLDRAFT_32959 [Phycomyces blakesleeanus NRRL 1555(-)]